MATKKQLPLFETNPVDAVAVRITHAGDGLSEALKVTPVALELGERVYYVLAGVVTQVNHTVSSKKKDDEDHVTRIHTVKAESITEIDGQYAGKLLSDAAEKLEKARAASFDQTMLGEDGEGE